MQINGVEAHVEKLDVEDGDVVVVVTIGPVSMETGERIRQLVAGVLHEAGKKAPVMVIDRSLEIKILKTSQLPDKE